MPVMIPADISALLRVVATLRFYIRYADNGVVWRERFSHQCCSIKFLINLVKYNVSHT